MLGRTGTNDGENVAITPSSVGRIVVAGKGSTRDDPMVLTPLSELFIKTNAVVAKPIPIKENAQIQYMKDLLPLDFFGADDEDCSLTVKSLIGCRGGLKDPADDISSPLSSCCNCTS